MHQTLAPLEQMQPAGGGVGAGLLLLDLPAPRARHSVGPELDLFRGRAKGGCDPTPAGESVGEGEPRQAILA